MKAEQDVETALAPATASAPSTISEDIGRMVYAAKALTKRIARSGSLITGPAH